MKYLRNRIINHPHYNKIKHWGKLIFITGSAQVLVQIVGFISGILVIRLLPVEEYALYTLANTMLGAMTVLSDGGISTGVMALGGKVWEDKTKLGVVLSTGLELRRKFAIGALAVSVPILCYLLLHHGATWVTAILIAASLIPAFFAALSDNLLQIAPKLHQAITPLQKNQMEVSIGRLLLTGLTLFAFPWTFVAILASGIPRIWGNLRLRKISDRFADKEQLPGVEERKEILKVVKKILPGSIYYAISGQLTIWLISIFGNTTSVAQLGALGRLMVIFNIFNVLVATLIVPRFARMENIRGQVVKKFFLIISGIVGISLATILLINFFSEPILYILGTEYQHLNVELLLSAVSGCLGLVVGIMFSLSSSRAYIISPTINIGISILTQILLIILLPLNDTKGVLLFSIIANIVIFFMFLINFIYYSKKIPIT